MNFSTIFFVNNTKSVVAFQMTKVGRYYLPTICTAIILKIYCITLSKMVWSLLIAGELSLQKKSDDQIFRAHFYDSDLNVSRGQEAS